MSAEFGQDYDGAETPMPMYAPRPTPLEIGQLSIATAKDNVDKDCLLDSRRTTVGLWAGMGRLGNMFAMTQTYM